jgi:2'-5' RNA ligase
MSASIHRLFFALCPDAEVGREIESTVATIKASGHVRGRWVQPSKHHLTLHFLGSHAARPLNLIERARAAAQRLRLAPFEIELVRIETFGARRQAPCIVRCSAQSDRSLEVLRAKLANALTEMGLEEWVEQRFTPHVTIAYVDGHLDGSIEIPPIAWRVRNFALVESHGATAHHEVLDQWALGEPGTT